MRGRSTKPKRPLRPDNLFFPIFSFYFVHFHLNFKPELSKLIQKKFLILICRIEIQYPFLNDTYRILKSYLKCVNNTINNAYFISFLFVIPNLALRRHYHLSANLVGRVGEKRLQRFHLAKLTNKTLLDKS